MSSPAPARPSARRLYGAGVAMVGLAATLAQSITGAPEPTWLALLFGALVGHGGTAAVLPSRPGGQ